MQRILLLRHLAREPVDFAGQISQHPAPAFPFCLGFLQLVTSDPEFRRRLADRVERVVEFSVISDGVDFGAGCFHRGLLSCNFLLQLVQVLATLLGRLVELLYPGAFLDDLGFESPELREASEYPIELGHAVAQGGNLLRLLLGLCQLPRTFLVDARGRLTRLLGALHNSSVPRVHSVVGIPLSCSFLP